MLSTPDPLIRTLEVQNIISRFADGDNKAVIELASFPPDFVLRSIQSSREDTKRRQFNIIQRLDGEPLLSTLDKLSQMMERHTILERAVNLYHERLRVQSLSKASIK